MSWTRILSPLTGAAGDEAALKAAADLASPFEATVAGVFAPADAADLIPWMGEGFMGGVQMAALDSMKQAAVEGERISRARLDRLGYAHKTFAVLSSPVWAALSMEARLSDVVVFGADPAKGKGPLVEAFQQILMEERRPIFIARRPADLSGVIALAWDGGREASRAARSAVPLLQKARQTVILSAPAATPRIFDPERLLDYLAGQGINVRVEALEGDGEAGPLLIEAVHRLGAGALVAGAFGHPRFQQFVFGGATRALMNDDAGPSLFLSH